MSDDFIESGGHIVNEREHLNNQMLEEAIKLIMGEWGYTREQTVKWLHQRIKGED